MPNVPRYVEDNTAPTYFRHSFSLLVADKTGTHYDATNETISPEH